MFGRVAEGGVCLNKYTSQICRVNAEAPGSTATLITTYETTRRYIPENYYLLFSSLAGGLKTKRYLIAIIKLKLNVIFEKFSSTFKKQCKIHRR
jgi:hypothetical protein